MLRRLMSLCLLLTASYAHSAPFKALYLTDFSNIYHDYKGQVESFLPALQEEFNFTYDVVGRKQGDLLTTLQDPDFAEGYDFIIYNACLADTRDFLPARRLMDAVAAGKPIALLHCAMHNFRKTSTNLNFIDRALLEADKISWSMNYPNEEFPTWWQFTGVDSTRHNSGGRLETKKAESHPITASFPNKWQSKRDELYLNNKVADGVLPLLTSKDGEHIVAWLHRYGAGQVFATSLGHDERTLNDADFIAMVARGMAHIVGALESDGTLAVEAKGNKLAYNYSKVIKCLPSQILTPSTIAEVQSIIRNAAANRTALKVVSLDNPNSYSDVICSKIGGTLINLRNFNQVLEVNKEEKTVRVQPGVTIDGLNKLLEKQGLVFPTTADYSGITIAGGLGTGAHHSSLNIESGVQDYLISMTLVDGQGNLVVLEGQEARELGVHLGYLGAIVEISLRVDENAKLRYGHQSGSDADLEDRVIELVKSHDYARVSWFAGVGRYVIDYFDKVDTIVKGDSYNNIWSSSAGPIRIVGSLPYDAINLLPPKVQCLAAGIRSNVWVAPIAAVDSDSNKPVGFTSKMLGSSCEKGNCPWDFGGTSRTIELAIPVDQVPAWMADVRAILERNKACFPVLGIYMRFAKQSDSFLSTSYGFDAMMFEIHIPKDNTGNSYERGTAAYDEIQQMTLMKYNGRPHWGKNSKPIFKDALAHYPKAEAFKSKKNELDPNGLFENEFWDLIDQGELQPAYAGCTLERTCICSKDSDCASGYSCEEGPTFAEARICLKK